MSGSIKRVPGIKNTWEIRYDSQDPVTNVRKQHKRRLKGTKAQAEQQLIEILSQINHGEYSDMGDITLGEYLEKWIENHCKIRLKYKAERSYIGIIRKYIIPNLGRIKLNNLKPAYIQDYYTNMGKPMNIGGAGLSSTTVLYHHRILNEALKHAVDLQYIRSNPASRVKAPRKNRPEMKTLSEEQIKYWLSKYRYNRIFLPVFLAIMTGMRLGEIMALRWIDVNLDQGNLKVTHSLQNQDNILVLKEPKTDQSRRTIPLPSQAIKMLQEIVEIQTKNQLTYVDAYDSRGFVCCWEDGKPFNPEWVGKQWKKLVKSDSNIPDGVRFHDIRHTHATILQDKGLGLKVIQERLGHESIATTGNIYAHSTPDMQQKAVNILESMFVSAEDGEQPACVKTVESK